VTVSPVSVPVDVIVGWAASNVSKSLFTLVNAMFVSPLGFF
jgi:hypothetical protein